MKIFVIRFSRFSDMEFSYNTCRHNLANVTSQKVHKHRYSFKICHIICTGKAVELPERINARLYIVYCSCDDVIFCKRLFDGGAGTLN